MPESRTRLYDSPIRKGVEPMSSSQKKMLVRLGIGVFLFGVCLFLPLESWHSVLAFAVPYLVCGWDILWRAIRNILRGQIFDENFLMALATVGAFAIGEAMEGVVVMLFYQIGEWFQGYAVGKSRRSISDLMEIRPDAASVERNGQILTVAPEEVQVGECIVILPGEKIPLDGVILEGTSSLNTTALTGESLPRDVKAGDDVIGGCVNLNGVLRVRVSREYGESTVAKILELVENSSENKAVTENFITRFARWYTPIVVIFAALLAIVPPLLLQGNWFDWVHRALTFLVISCPCALVISVPLSFFGGIGRASRAGILVKGSNYLETLAKSEIVIFDKTGTLTKGNFVVTAVHPQFVSEQELLFLAASVEYYSTHPLSEALRQAVQKPLDPGHISDFQQISGQGVCAIVDGKRVYAGNEQLMQSVGIVWKTCQSIGTIVHMALDGKYLGHIVISDEIKPGAKEAIGHLRALGVRKTVMLTGDNRNVAENVAEFLGIDEVRAELLPAEKVSAAAEYLADTSARGKVVFVGDGINDAPVLAGCDVGVAMGGLGADAAIEASDVVLMDDNPAKLPLAVKIARKTVGIVWQNIIFALAVKGIVLVLGACGFASMWAAVFADVGVSVLAILNAMRTLIEKKQS